MKKYLLMAIMACIGLSVTAQNKYLKDIQKSSNEFTGVTTYNVPSLWPGLGFYKNFIKDSVANNSIVVTCTCPVAFYDLKGAFIKLDDGTVIKNENAEPRITYDSAFGYIYSAEIILNNEDIKRLSEHTIVKFAISDFMETVNKKHAEAYRNYIICLKSIALTIQNQHF